jgi:hypothetical protein
MRIKSLRWNILGYALLGPLMIAALAACSSDDEASGDDEPAFTRVTEAELSAGDDIPVPANEEDIILTVTGNIGNPNQGDAIVMDLASIEMVGEVEYRVVDPFREEGDAEEVVFRGPLMSDLLALWGVSQDAVETLNVVALNDYAVDVPAGDLWEYPVIFALQADGEYMPVSTRGPAMLVYPYADFDFDMDEYNSYWVWQIKTIDVQ